MQSDKMFNTSKHSSERSSRSRDGHTQRGPSTQRSRSRSAHSDSAPQWTVPPWVHCEICFDTHDINPSLKLLSCGHIFCVKCLHLDEANLHDSVHIPCLRCNSSETYVSIGSLDPKLHGMFQQCWMDPVLQLDVKHISYMMAKTQNYSKYLSKSIKEGNTLPPEWQERQNRVKARIDRIAKLKKMEQEIAKKTEAIKAEATKVHKNICRYRAIYEKAKEYRRKQQQSQQLRQQQGQQQRQQQGQQQRQQQGQQQRQQQGQQQRQQQGQQQRVVQQQQRHQQGQQQQRQQQGQQQQRQQQSQHQQRQQQGQQQLQSMRSRGVEQAGPSDRRNEMKLISSGRNEQSNQYIGQLKSSGQQSTNANQSAPDIRNFSQRVVPPARQNRSLDVPRGDSSRHTPDSASYRLTMPTFRPQPKSINADNRRFEPAQPQAAKRLVPSYAYDQYTNPPKRAANYAEPVDLNTSISSVGSSTILNLRPKNINGQRMNALQQFRYK